MGINIDEPKKSIEGHSENYEGSVASGVPVVISGATAGEVIVGFIIVNDGKKDITVEWTGSENPFTVKKQEIWTRDLKGGPTSLTITSTSGTQDYRVTIDTEDC